MQELLVRSRLIFLYVCTHVQHVDSSGPVYSLDELEKWCWEVYPYSSLHENPVASAVNSFRISAKDPSLSGETRAALLKVVAVVKAVKEGKLGL